MIHLRDVSYTYPEGEAPALRNVDLDVPEGTVCAVVGPSGAGKSTLAHVIAGYLPHFEGGDITGTVRAAGLDITGSRLETIVTRVGLVLQNPFEQISGARFTVREEVAFGLENLGVVADEMSTRVDQMLDLVNIGQLAHRSPYELSGGQQQLVALASVLVMRPRVLVLDEPTSQLDPAGTDMVFAALRSLRTQQITTVMIEHKLEPVEQHADQVVVLVGGSVGAVGPPSQVLGRADVSDWGVGATRYSELCRELQTRDCWPSNTPIPVSLPDTARLLRGITNPNPAPEPSHRPATGAMPNHSVEPGSQGPPPTQKNTDIVVQDLRFHYPNDVLALDGVDLTIKQGERVAIIGENGAGKTTLAKHLIGIHRPTDGSVLVGGWDTREHPVASLAHRVGYLFQDPGDQLFARTVRREVEFGPTNLGYSPERVSELVGTALNALSLNHVTNLHPYQLTLAERKRVALASVLAMDTPVVVLDEPTTGQDHPAIQALEHVMGVLTQSGRTVVAITHDMDFAAENFARIVMMAHGRIIEDCAAGRAFSDKDALRQAAVQPPQTVRLAEALGLNSGILTVTALADRLVGAATGPAEPNTEAPRRQPDRPG